MLNQIEKNKILNDIKNQSIEKLIKEEINSKKWNMDRYNEILEFLINEVNDSLSNKRKKTTKTLSKLIYCLYIIYNSILNNKEKLVLNEETLNMLLKLKNKYIENIENTDDIDIKIFDELYININNLNKIEFIEQEKDIDNIIIPNIDSEQIEQIKNKLKDAKKKIKELNKEIKELKFKLSMSFDEDTVRKYKEEIKELNDKISELNNTISKLGHKNQSNEISNNNLKKQITEITNSFTNKNKELENKLVILREKANLYDKEVIQKEYEKELDNLILMYIADNDLVISELLEILKDKFPNITKETILNSLKRLQEKYILNKNKIINNEFSYKLGKKRNSIFNYEVDNNSLDIIVISDMHINNNIDISLINLNYIYDYAAKNNIKTIINLGDIIDSRIYNDKSILENLRKYEELVDNVILKLPKDDNIINLLLGGNHDRSLFDLGIDATDRISKNRLDYLNLGFDHSLLQFNDNKIGLHHPNRRFDNFVNIDNINDNELVKYINNYYKYKNIDRKYSFIDLLGHFHVSKLSIPNNYITIPSLNRDYIQNGAYRIKLYFDSKGNIINSILIPLIVDEKVLESTSINYQKIK